MFLLTDYGLADEFVGVVRAVLARLAPGAAVVDVTHGIAPFDVRSGALALARAAPHLGRGVVMAVVDPAVGTSRRAVAVELDNPGGPSAMVGPDNGLLIPAADALGGVRHAVALPSGADPHHRGTFDGRDVFAPAAAALWLGTALQDLGETVPVGGLARLAPAHCRVAEGSVEAEVLWVDRFGNVQLAATAADGDEAGLGSALELQSGRTLRSATRVSAFAQVERDAMGLLVDANGQLTVVCDRASAATVLGVSSGDLVTVRRARGERNSQ